MPEGDTLHKTAAALREDLEGELVRELQLRDRGPVEGVAGMRIGHVEAVGKHLLIGLGDRWVLRVHLGMKGRFHRYVPGQKWGRPASSATVVLRTDRREIVCFRGSRAVLERTRAGSTRPPRGVEALGPDLLAAELDLQQLVRRIRARCTPCRSVGEALLDQALASGIGNVYRSEILFLEGLHPQTPVGSLTDAELEQLYGRARELMQANLSPGPRRTVTGGNERLWVYRRRRRPCMRCATPVERMPLGDQARSVYWCPRCQPARRESDGAG
jgi:endonuclease-8